MIGDHLHAFRAGLDRSRADEGQVGYPALLGDRAGGGVQLFGVGMARVDDRANWRASTSAAIAEASNAPDRVSKRASPSPSGRGLG